MAAGTIVSVISREATSTVNGLMSSTDKNKLDSMLRIRKIKQYSGTTASTAADAEGTVTITIDANTGSQRIFVLQTCNYGIVYGYSYNSAGTQITLNIRNLSSSAHTLAANFLLLDVG